MCRQPGIGGFLGILRIWDFLPSHRGSSLPTLDFFRLQQEMSPSQRKCPTFVGVFLQHPGVSTIVFRCYFHYSNLTPLFISNNQDLETWSRIKEGVTNELAE